MTRDQYFTVYNAAVAAYDAAFADVEALAVLMKAREPVGFLFSAACRERNALWQEVQAAYDVLFPDLERVAA